jgi:hypothetical protein
MKKIFFAITMASFLLSGCFISNIFRKKEKYGCPSDGRNVGAEKVLSGQKPRKAKYRIAGKVEP